MKIAIQISGDFRMLHMSLPNLEEYVLRPCTAAGHSVDFFVHTWEHADNNPHTFPFPERGLWHMTMATYGHTVGLNAFKPKHHVLEAYESKTDLHVLPRSMSMFYGIYMANKARKTYELTHDVEYDLIVRYRTDCLFKEYPFAQVDMSKLTIPQSRMVASCDGGTGGVCDWIAWGPPAQMDVYCNTYMDWLDASDRPGPERMLAESVKKTVVYRPLLDFYLVEGNGSIRGVLAAAATEQTRR